MAAGFDKAANGILPPTYPQPATSTQVHTVPPSLLKAVGWVESNWRQFSPRGKPLLSFDFGYGIMQITSGMDGAFGKLHGEIDSASQSAIASDYQFNIAYGKRVLAQKWVSMPRVGNGDPTAIENWYYAVWAYNGWGWVNNPNNPRFSRAGTPLTNPSGFPYQERVLYLVSHPPRDTAGNPLWQPVPVSLPSRSLIGSSPHSFTPKTVHFQRPPASWVVYEPSTLLASRPGSTRNVTVRLINTGTQPWLSSGDTPVSLTYHVFNQSADPFASFSPFTDGVVSFGQSPLVITRDVLPGQSITLRSMVHVPQKVGTYQVAWDLQRGNGTWFSQAGVPVRVQKLRVQVGPMATPTTVLYTPTPAPKPRVSRRLQFVADTSPDGAKVGVRQTFQKGWLVFNAGSTNWKEGWVLALVSGKSFGVKSIRVPPTRACKAVDIIATLRAPSRVGMYAEVWQMRDPVGHLFGDRLTLSVKVSGPGGPPTATPVTTPTLTPRPGPTSTATPVG